MVSICHPDRPAYGNSLCNQCYHKDWYQQNKAKCNTATRRNHLRTKYGMTEEDYRAMLIGQDGICLICSQELSKTRPVIDHCHMTQQVRGILCDSCNIAIGKFRDDPDILRKAIKYLEKACVDSVLT